MMIISFKAALYFTVNYLISVHAGKMCLDKKCSLMPKLQSHISLQQRQRECAKNFALKCLRKRYIPSSAKSLAFIATTDF